MSRIERHVRLFNSLNWVSYNSETLGFLNNNQESLITIATDTLSVGWDSKYTWNAVLLGETDNVDEFVQKIGHIGHNHQAVSHPRAFLYYTHGTLAKAQLVIEQHHEASSTKGQNR
jgi:Lhr-like helicase